MRASCIITASCPGLICIWDETRVTELRAVTPKPAGLFWWLVILLVCRFAVDIFSDDHRLTNPPPPPKTCRIDIVVLNIIAACYAFISSYADTEKYYKKQRRTGTIKPARTFPISIGSRFSGNIKFSNFFII